MPTRRFKLKKSIDLRGCKKLKNLPTVLLKKKSQWVPAWYIKPRSIYLENSGISKETIEKLEQEHDTTGTAFIFSMPAEPLIVHTTQPLKGSSVSPTDNSGHHQPKVRFSPEVQVREFTHDSFLD